MFFKTAFPVSTLRPSQVGEEEPLPPLAQGRVVSPVCLSLLKDSLTAGLPGPSFVPACVPHVGGALFLAQTQLFPPHAATLHPSVTSSPTCCAHHFRQADRGCAREPSPSAKMETNHVPSLSLSTRNEARVC